MLSCREVRLWVCAFLVLLPSVSKCSSVINKCCLRDERFDQNLTCYKHNDTTNATVPSLLFLQRYKMYNFTVNYGFLPCVDLEYSVKSNTNNYLDKNGTYYLQYPNQTTKAKYSSFSYCIDHWELDGELFDVAYYCPCLEYLCIFKCCAREEHLQIKERSSRLRSVNSCVPKNNTEITDWHHSDLNGTGVTKYHEFKYKKPKCGARHTLELEGEYFLQENGSIMSSDGEILPKDYCGDLLIDGDELRKTVLACIPFSWPVVRLRVYAVLGGIGAVFLLVTAALHLWLPELAGNPANCLVAHTCSLLVGYVGTPISQFLVEPDRNFQCFFIGYLIHFSFLASFFWLNIMCMDVSWQFSKISRRRLNKRTQSRKFLWQSLYAWGCTSICTGTALALDLAPGVPTDSWLKPNFGITNCWFHGTRWYEPVMLFFYGPMGLLLFSNSCFFFYTTWRIILLSRGSGVLEHADSVAHAGTTSVTPRQRKSYYMYIKIFSMMGVSWIMEIVSWAVGGPDYIWYLTDAFNVLRAVFIFIIFCWKPNVWNALKKKVPSVERVTTLERHFVKKAQHSADPSTDSTNSETSGKSVKNIEMTPTN